MKDHKRSYNGDNKYGKLYGYGYIRNMEDGTNGRLKYWRRKNAKCDAIDLQEKVNEYVSIMQHLILLCQVMMLSIMKIIGNKYADNGKNLRLKSTGRRSKIIK